MWQKIYVSRFIKSLVKKNLNLFHEDAVNRKFILYLQRSFGYQRSFNQAVNQRGKNSFTFTSELQQN